MKFVMCSQSTNTNILLGQEKKYLCFRLHALLVPHENIDQQQQNMTNFIPQTNYNQVRQKQITCVSTINPTDPKVFWPLLNKHYYSLETS
jgi:hypothetical protein